MAITAKLFANFPLNLGGGSSAASSPIDLLSDAINLTLHTATYTPTQTTDALFATATNELTTAGGYTAGGQALASKTYTLASLTSTFAAANVTWTSTSITFRHGVLHDDTVANVVKPLIGYIDTGGNQTTSSVDVVMNWNASGVFTIAVT
jgi:hypothetical protein